MKFFSKKSNADLVISVVGTGNKTKDRTFYVLSCPSESDINETNLSALFGSNYKNVIMQGSIIYTNAFAQVKTWDVADGEFK